MREHSRGDPVGQQHSSAWGVGIDPDWHHLCDLRVGAVATGVSHWLIVLGDELELWMFSNLAFGGRIVLGAVFFIWVGRFVYQSPAPASYAD